MTREETGMLDNPVWAALTTGNRELAEGGPLALRYPPEIAPFAAVPDTTAPAFAALAELVPPAGRIALCTPDRLEPPAGFAVNLQAPVVQMVLDAPVSGPPCGPAPALLSAADVADMLDLAGRTRPGPFNPRTIELGRYIGFRVASALAAMAGERMRLGRFVEVSAVCVDPAHRGKGFAALLVTRISEALQADGLTPFLHVFADNTGAIRLYEKLGFAARRTLCMTSLSAQPA